MLCCASVHCLQFPGGHEAPTATSLRSGGSGAVRHKRDLRPGTYLHNGWWCHMPHSFSSTRHCASGGTMQEAHLRIHQQFLQPPVCPQQPCTRTKQHGRENMPNQRVPSKASVLCAHEGGSGRRSSYTVHGQATACHAGLCLQLVRLCRMPLPRRRGSGQGSGGSVLEAERRLSARGRGGAPMVVPTYSSRAASARNGCAANQGTRAVTKVAHPWWCPHPARPRTRAALMQQTSSTRARLHRP